jgi:AraC-like DNA-binding protein
MQFQNIPIHPLLKGYIEKMWLFKSSGRALNNDIKLIVPSGRIKIALPFRNGIVAEVDGWSHFTKEHSITLVGLFDMPSTMDIATNSASGTICAEFSPHGAYRFFHLQLSDLRNRFFSLTDILDNTAKRLEEQIANTESIEDKASLFQQFLLKRFLKQSEDPIFEYCVEKIKSSEGKITIKELEKKTGYSSRWLNMKFTEKLGVSPKNLASIIRFKQYYEMLCDNKQKKSVSKNFYNYYYDQSHFIKDFKRFTGLTPTTLEKKVNDFGKIFYNV